MIYMIYLLLTLNSQFLNDVQARVSLPQIEVSIAHYGYAAYVILFSWSKRHFKSVGTYLMKATLNTHRTH
jgi:hypothetical protein